MNATRPTPASTPDQIVRLIRLPATPPPSSAARAGGEMAMRSHSLPHHPYRRRGIALPSPRQLPGWHPLPPAPAPALVRCRLRLEIPGLHRNDLEAAGNVRPTSQAACSRIEARAD